MNFTDQDSDEIVALYINDVIYLGQAAIDKVHEVGKVDGIIKRAIFKFMAEFDLDPKWEEYANYPTLFTLTEYNAWARGEPIGQTKSHPSGDDSESSR